MNKLLEKRNYQRRNQIRQEKKVFNSFLRTGEVITEGKN